MRRILLASTFVLFATPALAETITVTIDGMVCAFCAQGVEEKLNERDEVKSVAIDVDKGRATIVTNGNATLSDDVINQAVDYAGYKVTKISRRP